MDRENRRHNSKQSNNKRKKVSTSEIEYLWTNPNTHKKNINITANENRHLSDDEYYKNWEDDRI